MAPKCDALTPDDLRKKLYQTFRDRGVLDALKTQLRNLLVHELMGPVLRGELRPRSVPVEGSALLLGASNALVADHLRTCGYEYSLSVFFPESGLAKEKVFTMQDLLQLVRVDPASRLYESLISGLDKENRKGFLVEFLRELAEQHQAGETRAMATQTDAPAPDKDSLAEKLQLIDEAFADQRAQRPRAESLETKLNEYKRDVEERLRAELGQRLNHLKETEIAKVKMEEKRRHEQALAEVRAGLETAWRAKSASLVAREKEMVESVRRHQEIEAKEIYAQRQLLLRDMEVLRGREAELRQRAEAFELDRRLQEENSRRAWRRARAPGAGGASAAEETFDQRLRSELLRCQLELKDDHIARTRRLLEEEQKNRENAVRLQEELAAVSATREELGRSQSRVRDLELELEALRAQVLTLTEQNRALSERVQDTRDHSRLREEKRELQAQNRSLRQQLEDGRQEHARLLSRIAHPAPELLMFQEELKKAEDAVASEHRQFEAHRQALQTQLRSEVERSARLQAQVSDYGVSVRRLTARVADLESQLKDTQAALEIEVNRGPAPRVPGRPAGALTGAETPPPHGDFRGDVPTGPLWEPEVAAAAPSTARRPASEGGSPDSDLEFVANTKARVRELEREADRLDKAFRSYRRRAPRKPARSPAPPTSPPRSPATPTSPALPRSLAPPTSLFPPTSLAPPSSLAPPTSPPTSQAPPTSPPSLRSGRLSSTPRPEAERSLGEETEGQSRSHMAAPSPCLHKTPRPAPAEASHSPSVRPPAGPPEDPIRVDPRQTEPEANAEFSDTDGNVSRNHEEPESARGYQTQIGDQEEDDETREQGRREERRRGDPKDAVERERRELERLDRQRRMIEESLNIKTEKELETSGADAEDRAVRGDGPLEKYMRLLQRGRERRSRDQSPEDTVKGGSSPVETLPSGEHEESSTGFSRDETEDLW
ncbi:LOW QUALITY PROTEIN: centriole and centriolar satellite protein OFD1 [Lepus europaeus]|uniref:LOW QUALITY PROTEIN: centriole and centriolar satellite protein OFD1 n=1 Tax=Lepus europaeus TaxID=9983 RepID=UPI002B46B88D|nr:LOW QUALITY PROTEIN: centriole and centriolar satellite protein OFD1 [Lepus europaeus]